jgi:WhiB family redox-sensing transcriptional regulator
VADLARYCLHDGEIGDSGELLELIQMGRPAWMRDSLCREHPEVDFVPPDGGSTVEAKRVCRQCLVVDRCKEFALNQPAALDGVWGGTTPDDRARLRALEPRRYPTTPMVVRGQPRPRQTTEDGRILPGVRSGPG